MKRKLIDEIKTIKERSEFNSRYSIFFKFASLEYVLDEYIKSKEKNKIIPEEFLRYIIISSIACFETTFRLIVKDLVDHGKPFSDNVINYNQSKNTKFDFEIISAIQSKMVTAGEFVSHILSFNNYDDIDSHISTLLGSSFTEALKGFKKKSIYELTNKNTDYFISNFSDIIISVKRTFELRHIFCHEYATDVEIDVVEIQKCFIHSKVFLEQVNGFIHNQLFPNVPEAQSEMNKFAINEFTKIDSELNDLITQIKSISKKSDHITLFFNDDLFDESIEHWKKYREFRAKNHANLVKGGTMYPTLYYPSLSHTTKEKIESLKREYYYPLKKQRFD